MANSPKLASREELLTLAAAEGMAQGTIGKIVIAMLKSGSPISREAILGALSDAAEGRDANVAEVLANGALQFIANLPPERK